MVQPARIVDSACDFFRSRVTLLPPLRHPFIFGPQEDVGGVRCEMYQVVEVEVEVEDCQS